MSADGQIFVNKKGAGETGRPLFEIRGLCKSFGETAVLKNISTTISQGEVVVIVGPSGSGKSTMLNLMGGMDRPSEGELYYREQKISDFTSEQLSDYRKDAVGFVFQFFHLIPTLTAKENVELAASITKGARSAGEVLELVGLSDRMKHFPSQMSGGEQQRVSIARAIVKNPEILLCDEPTGALDYKTGKQILKLLQDTARKEKMTVLIITHNGAISPMADKVIHFKNGTVENIEINENPKPVEEIEW